MSRYNHHILEQKWLKRWGEHPTEKTKFQVGTLYLPKDDSALDLENLRLLMLADFFGYTLGGSGAQILWLSGERLVAETTSVYGFYFSSFEEDHEICDFLLVPRDFTHFATEVSYDKRFLCGRFLDSTPVHELHGDFGLDALRLFFLSQGPPTRDYGLDWDSLVASFRFVEKIWKLGQVIEQGPNGQNREDLHNLKICVRRRWQQKKPHTALAAIMGFLKDKNSLDAGEAYLVINLLRPYTPFIAAELLSLVPSI